MDVFERARPETLSRIAAIAAAGLLLPLTDLFYFFPGIDLAVARLFGDAGGFALSGNPVLAGLRAYGFFVYEVVILLAVLGLLVPVVTCGRRFPVPPLWSLYFVLSAIVGPGLVVNWLLKGHWGRARPVHLAEFGGSAGYSRVWEIVDACRSNCSFVSGEGASAATLLALVLLAPPRLRRPVLVAVGAFAVAVSATRIAFGGHFLSDVVIAWCLTLMVMGVVYEAVRATGLDDDRLAGALGAAGRRIAAVCRQLAGGSTR